MRSRMRIVSAVVLASMLALIVNASSLAQSTSKKLSTNFTLVNLSSQEAVGNVRYIFDWGERSEDFSIPGNGGQLIFRQYDPPGNRGNPNLEPGAGSAIVTANQPLGAVVQIQARGQNPTANGAYAGFSEGDTSFYVPLVAKNITTASGTGNSQIIVQNVGSSPTTVKFQFVGIGGSGDYEYTKGIAAGASFTCDLTTDCGGGVPSGWAGAAVVTAVSDSEGKIAVVSNFFTGDAMQTFNAFNSSTPTPKWFVPLFTSRLPNNLNSPVGVQNLSGDAIAPGTVELSCTPAPGNPNPSFSMKNTNSIEKNAVYFFNPVTDNTMPTDFTGSCVVDAQGKNVVVFVQLRFVNAGEAAAYEAIPAGGTDKTVVVPLVAKRLSNGFATVATIQNLSSEPATVKLRYTPAGGGNPIEKTMSIPANGSLIQNHRISSGTNSVPELNDGWVGSLTVESNTPINGFVQLTFWRAINPNLPSGDNFMAHNIFTLP